MGIIRIMAIKQSILSKIAVFQKDKIQVIWQTGKEYFLKAKQAISMLNVDNSLNVGSAPQGTRAGSPTPSHPTGLALRGGAGGGVVFDFINRMDYAYAVADIIVSRAGAIAVSELCSVGKPVVLIPSPNVAEDHQTKNALALENKGAAILIKDSEAKEKLGTVMIELINNNEKHKKKHMSMKLIK